MCISVLSTSHPDYPFILISNRDEFIARPTLRADWWQSPNDHVLGGRDLKRAERGTWLGITKQGRIAILTNFREDYDTVVDMSKSRGAMVNSYLCTPSNSSEAEEDFVQRLIDDVGITDVGGFTMLFGRLQRPKTPAALSHHQPLTNGTTPNGHATAPPNSMPGLALVSNRTANSQQLRRIATSLDETHGVSNSHFGDTTWPKVVHGEQLLQAAIREHVSSSSSHPDQLIASLLHILDTDALPRRKDTEDWEMFVRHMRNSILIPPAKGEAVVAGSDVHGADGLSGEKQDPQPGHRSAVLPQVGKGAYGTSQQTVILVGWGGEVTFVERTLYDMDGVPVPESERDVQREFVIEGWDREDV